MSVDAAGVLNVNAVLSGSSTVTANQGTANTIANAWPVKLTDGTLSNTFTANGLKVDGSAVTQPISAASLPLPTGASTSANQATIISSLSTISGQLPTTLGAHVISASLAVNIASDQVVPVSASSLPLPAGAATSALQTSGNSSLSSIDGKLNSLGAHTIATSVAVNIASDQVVPVSATSLPLPTGAATAANQTTANASLSSIDSKLTSPLTVTGTIKAGGKAAVDKARNDYSSVNVTTAAYVQLIASTAGTATEIFIFDSSGQTLVLAFGAAASEIDQIYIVPGGNGTVALAIPAATRISIKAVSATASAGEIDINLLG